MATALWVSIFVAISLSIISGKHWREAQDSARAPHR